MDTEVFRSKLCIQSELSSATGFAVNLVKYVSFEFPYIIYVAKLLVIAWCET